LSVLALTPILEVSVSTTLLTRERSPRVWLAR